MPSSVPPKGRLVLEERGLRHAPAQPGEASLAAELARRAGDLPEGTCRRFVLRPGLDVTLYDCAMAPGHSAVGRLDPGLVMTVLLDGAGHGFLRREDGGEDPLSVPYAAGTTYFCFGDVPVTGRSCLGGRTTFRGIELRLGIPFLESIGMADAFRQAGAGHRLTWKEGPGLWIGLVRTPEAMARLAAMLLGEGMGPETDDLAVERLGLNLLGEGMAVIRRPPDGCAGSRDEARLRQARRLLIEQSSEAWNITGLARRVGLNERKLKNGFRSVFGTSVLETLTQARLAEGYRLLSQGSANVASVVAAIGYSNPSHFAAKFRRAYGMPPSAVAGLSARPQRPAAGNRASPGGDARAPVQPFSGTSPSSIPSQ